MAVVRALVIDASLPAYGSSNRVPVQAAPLVSVRNSHIPLIADTSRFPGGKTRYKRTLLYDLLISIADPQGKTSNPEPSTRYKYWLYISKFYSIE